MFHNYSDHVNNMNNSLEKCKQIKKELLQAIAEIFS